MQSPLSSDREGGEGYELHTLSENEEDEMVIELEETAMRRGGGEAGAEGLIEERGRETAIELGEPVFVETVISGQPSLDEPFVKSTLISSDHTPSLMEVHQHHIGSPPSENFDYSNPPTLSNFRSPLTLSDEFSLPTVDEHDLQTQNPLFSLDTTSDFDDISDPPMRDSLPSQLPTGPQQSSIVPPPLITDWTSPPKRTLAHQELAGPLQRSVDDGRISPQTSIEHHEDTKFFDVR